MLKASQILIRTLSLPPVRQPLGLRPAWPAVSADRSAAAQRATLPETLNPMADTPANLPAKMPAAERQRLPAMSPEAIPNDIQALMEVPAHGIPRIGGTGSL
jgi:hypothetical protein